MTAIRTHRAKLSQVQINFAEGGAPEQAALAAPGVFQQTDIRAVAKRHMRLLRPFPSADQNREQTHWQQHLDATLRRRYVYFSREKRRSAQRFVEDKSATLFVVRPASPKLTAW